MCSEGSYEDIFELVDPIKSYIRGVCALIHYGDENSKEANYLLKINNELGAGNIIFGPYGRHDHSRNRILYETGMKEGDWYCQCDLLERVKPTFLEVLPVIIEKNPELEAIYYFGKPLAVKFKEELFYRGNPHEGLSGLNSQFVIELNQWSPDEKLVRENLRPIKRKDDKFHWCGHYLRYLLLENSNQNLLGLEHHVEKYPLEKKEQIRKDLIKFLHNNFYPRTVAGVSEAMQRVGPNGKMKRFINEHKIINDFYRLKILNDQTVTDSHAQKDWDNMPQF